MRKIIPLFFVIASLHVGASLPAESADSPLTKVSYQQAGPPSGTDAPVYLAKSLGLYAKEGLDVEIVSGKTSFDAVNAVAANQVTFANANGVSVLLSVARGQKVTAVASRYGRNNQALFLDDRSAISSLKDLRDKKIAVSGSSTQATFMELVRRAGGDPASNQFIIIPQLATMVNLFAAGTVDGVITTVPFGKNLIGDKRRWILFPFADFGLQEPSYTIIAQPSIVERQPDLVRKFLKATYEGFRLANENSKAAALAAGKFAPALDTKSAQQLFDLSREFVCSDAQKGTPVGLQSVSDWTKAEEFYRSIKMIEQPVKIESFVDNQFFQGSSSVAQEDCNR